MKRPRLARERARVERSGYSGFHFQLGTRSGLLRSCSLGREGAGAFAVYARPLKVERYIKFRAPREHSSLHCALNVKGPFVSQPCSGSFFLHAASASTWWVQPSRSSHRRRTAEEAVLDIYRFIESLLAPHPSLFCPPSAGFIAIAATAADTVNFSEDSRYPSTL